MSIKKLIEKYRIKIKDVRIQIKGNRETKEHYQSLMEYEKGSQREIAQDKYEKHLEQDKILRATLRAYKEAKADIESLLAPTAQHPTARGFL